MLGEIPSLKDRITVVRQLWDLTRDVLVYFQFSDKFHILLCHGLEFTPFSKGEVSPKTILQKERFDMFLYFMLS